MGKFILQESEKEQIRKMYGLVNEQTLSNGHGTKHEYAS